jgi:hypothetical protein
MTPTHLKLATAFSGSRRDTSLVAAVTLTVPGAKEPFASEAFSFSGIRPGAAPYDRTALIGRDGKWSARLNYSQPLQTRLGKQAVGAQFFNPVNITVAVTETQEANAFLQAVANALGDAETQKAVVAAVGDALPTPANVETQALAEIDDKNGLVQAVADAEAAVFEEKTAQVTLDQANETARTARGDAKAKADLAVATAEAALKTKHALTIKAKAAANKAAIKAQQAQPYPDVYTTR